MTIQNALAGIAVKDLSSASAWYEKLLGRPADAKPMPELAEWGFPKGGWLQVFQDTERGGLSSVTLAVDGLDDQLADLENKGIAVGKTDSSNYVKTAIVKDPDGNQIVFAEALSEENRSVA